MTVGLKWHKTLSYIVQIANGDFTKVRHCIINGWQPSPCPPLPNLTRTKYLWHGWFHAVWCIVDFIDIDLGVFQMYCTCMYNVHLLCWYSDISINILGGNFLEARANQFLTIWSVYLCICHWLILSSTPKEGGGITFLPWYNVCNGVYFCKCKRYWRGR